ncbi:MAG: hypothetical protein HY898_14420 [Deltaproteobacteria bacterium]|nr:hypothetical protein [Deltaproteobacteria bacterium]
MRICGLSLFAVTLVALGCGKGQTPAPVDAAPAASASAAPTQPFVARPEDIDVARVRDPLKCTPASKKPVCMTLNDFEKADAWNLETIRGADARYFGQGTFIEKGVSRDAYVFLIAKRVPTNDVAAGDLPLKVAVRELDASLKAENTHAVKLMRALQQDDAFAKTNATVMYLKTYAPSSWDGANVTTGPSTILHSQGGVFVRESKNRRLYAVRLAPMAPDTTPGDGMYATLYPVSW